MAETSTTSTAAENSAQPNKFEQLRVIPWSLGYDLANTFFVQLSFLGSIFILFLNDLNLTEAQIGVLLSAFPFLSLLSLFITQPVARLGFRKTFIASMVVRNVFTAGLLVVPFLAARFGLGAAIAYVAAATIGFAISRAVAMTAFLPWQQEYIPQSMRGRVSGYSSIIVSLAGLVAVAIGGFLIDRPLGPWRYPLLFGIGVLFGMLSILMASRFPGGRSFGRSSAVFKIDSQVLQPLRDSRFTRYLVVLGLVTLAVGPIYSFLPLFMRQKVGLDNGSVVFLQTGSLIGSLLSSFFWGWLADRYGSKPISMTGLLMTGILPILWFSMPRLSPVSFPMALSISFLQGIASTGWSIGSGRMLFVSIVSGENKTEYLSQYNAWTGVLSGIGSIMGGYLLQAFSNLQTTVANLHIDAYAILFALGVLASLVCAFILRPLATQREAGLVEFAGLFFHGNPLTAVSSMIRFYNAREEAQVLSATQSLGMTHSPLTVEELIHSLNDPRFYVRYEAIVSISRHSDDERLMQALVDVMKGPEPALATVAAWALSRLGNRDAIPALRQTLRESRFRSVQIQASRALARFGDRQLIPWLKEHIHDAGDQGMQMASASGLGKLHVVEATPDLLALLAGVPDSIGRREAGLALARLLGSEVRYIQLMRAFNEDLGTAMALEMDGLRTRLKRSLIERRGMAAQLTDARDNFAADRLQAGFQSFLRIVEGVASSGLSSHCRQILSECGARIRESGASRPEYSVLAVLAMERCAK